MNSFRGEVLQEGCCGKIFRDRILNLKCILEKVISIIASLVSIMHRSKLIENHSVKYFKKQDIRICDFMRL